MRRAALALVLVPLLAAPACHGQGASRASGRELVISRVMADPSALPDDRGEWIEITNVGSVAADLRGWTIGSANDPEYEVRDGVQLPPSGAVVVARHADAAAGAGARVALVYRGIMLGNSADWVVLRDPDGVTRDSVAWIAPPRGAAIDRRSAATRERGPVNGSSLAPPATARELVVHVLDVGQGDATVIRNGGSTVIVDGGPDRRILGRWLDRLGVRDTIDAVILTHAHSDHYEGLRELFATRRRLSVRYFWSNGDAAASMRMSRLPDSITSRVRAGAMIYRDTDDPCADGRSAACTLTLRGGARVHILRPMAGAAGQNDRSAVVKVVGPDSASFTMWLAGDAELPAIGWFTGAAGYARTPGMRADVLKANHHGSCDGVTARYLELVKPSVVVASLAAMNDYGHMHAQAKAAFRRHGAPWYRTDQNGTVTFRSAGTPGSRYTVTAERGAANADGPSDRRSNEKDCRGM